MKVIILFESINETLKIEDALDGIGMEFRSVVKPRALGSDCGVAIRIDRDKIPNVSRISREQNCHIVGIFEKKDNQWINVHYLDEDA